MKIENINKPFCIRTYSGKYVNVFDPNPDDLCIEDIAHSLSRQCRFGGHLHHHYSVAQHSVFCASLVAEKDKFEALMHDSSEAFLLDLPRPIKKQMNEYSSVEDKLMKALAEKFEFQFPMSESVKEADDFMLHMEWNELMISKKDHILFGGAHHQCLSAEKAKNFFLETFYLLQGTASFK
jgi:uncharacterized protein